MIMGFLGWLREKMNDDTMDDSFVQLEEDFIVEWNVWALDNEYQILTEIPGEILKTSQKSPFLKCDRSRIFYPLMKEHDRFNVYSFYLEKEFGSFFSSSKHTYNCLVAAVGIDLGDGLLEMEAELKDMIGRGKKCLISIGSDLKKYSFKIYGEPEDFVKDFFTDKMTELFKTFDNIHMSYVDGYFFLIRPTPRKLDSGVARADYVMNRFAPGAYSVLDLRCHRTWDVQGVKWVGEIVDQLDRDSKK